MSDSVEQLRSNTLFDGLQSAELDALLAQIPISELPAGAVILSEGSATESANAEIYLIIAGTVNVVRMLSEDREHAVTQMHGGDFFGETAVFTSGPRSARISAATPVTIGRVNRDLLDQILAIDPMTAVRTIIRVLTRRLREANDTIISNHLRTEKLTAIGTITGQIAHDLKSPLQAVAGVADMLVDPLVQMPREKQAAIIRRGVKSVTGLVEDILAFASDKPRRPYQPIAINDVLKNVEDFGLTEIERKGRVHIDRQIEQVPPITGDAVAIERMLLNLTKNAAEAMESGGTLTLCVRQVDGQVEMIVQDTGSGIPEEVRAKLFQSFVTSGKPGGTGLGLAMVKRTVDAHGGTIGVESAPGVGTKFTVRIPCTPSKNPAPPNSPNSA